VDRKRSTGFAEQNTHLLVLKTVLLLQLRWLCFECVPKVMRCCDDFATLEMSSAIQRIQKITAMSSGRLLVVRNLCLQSKIMFNPIRKESP
jgi:hypothetical protein